MKRLLILLLFPLMMFAQDSTLVGDVDCSGEVNSQDASLILQFVTNVIDTLPCQDNMTGLTPEQLQEIISLMSEQLNVNYTGGGSINYPVMISTESNATYSNFGEAMAYCYDLEENSYSDWFLPSLEQLIYIVSGGAELPDQLSENVIITSSISSNQWNENQLDDFLMLRLDNGEIMISDNFNLDGAKVRCVRFGEGETSEGSSGFGSSVGESSEQPITMIGPRYTQDEFPDFIHHNLFYDYNDRILYFDAILFCAQLDYDGYDDWYLPTITQIKDYYFNNSGELIIPNTENVHDYWLYNNLQTLEARSFKVRVSGSENPYPNRVVGVELSDIDENNADVQCFCVR